MNLEALKAAKFDVLGETCRFEIKEYYNKRMALQVVALTGEPYGVLSVNLPHSAIPEGCVAIKDYSENVDMAANAFATGLFKDTHVKAEGMPIWQIL